MRWRYASAWSKAALTPAPRDGSASDSPRSPRPSLNLKESLGVSLLLRSSRELTPTEAGQNFYECAKRSIEEADEAELATRDEGAGLSGTW